MNATIHQLKWDLRRLRTLWVIWLLILLATTFGYQHATSTSDPYSALARFTEFGKMLAVYPLAILLIARLMFSTPFAGPNAFWKTRPLTRPSLFWTKTILILGLIQLPVSLSQWAVWRNLNLGEHYLFWATLHFGSLTLAVFFLTAVWASLCERFGSFGLCLVSTGAFLAVCVIVFIQVSARVAFLPLHPRDSEFYGATVGTSTLITMMVILFLTALLAWVLGALLGKRPAALASIAIGMMLAAGANSLWKTDFLRETLTDSLPELEVDALVLDQAEQVTPEFQSLWAQVAVKLPKKQFAEPVFWSASFAAPGAPASSTSESRKWEQSELLHLQRLAAFYPDDTRLQTGLTAPDSLLTDSRLAGKRATLSGVANLTIYEWQRVASLPLQPGASTEILDGGLIRIKAFWQDILELTQIQPPSPFRVLSNRYENQSWGRRDAQITVVLYDPDADLAIVARRRGYSGMGGGPLTVTRRTETFELNSQRLRSLAETKTRGEALGGLRVDVFLPVPVGSSRIEFEKKDWLAYYERKTEQLPITSAPHPSIEKAPLPADPTADQIDTYLDGILFNLSDRLTSEERTRLEVDLEAIGPAHLDRLLARLPVGNYAQNFVDRVIRKLIREEHKPAVLETLREDMGLSPLVLERGWGAEAAPIVAEHLRQRRPLGYENALAMIQIVAEQRDPATYDDLRWHFVHAVSGVRSMARLLASCPNFPIDAALAELWKKARFESGGRRFEIAGLVARLGEKEALRDAFLKFVSDEQAEDLRVLEEAVEGPVGEALPAWLHKNFEALTFNPKTRTFALPGS